MTINTRSATVDAIEVSMLMFSGLCALFLLATGCTFDDPALHAEQARLIEAITDLSQRVAEDPTGEDVGKLIDAKLRLAELARQSTGIDWELVGATAGSVAASLFGVRLWRGSTKERRGLPPQVTG